MTIKVNAGTDTDTVMLKGGRVGTLSTASGGATDTLIGVEYIGLAGEAAQSSREDDVIDVTMMASGAVVDYTNGEIRTGAAAGSGVQLVIENIVQMEKVIADGNDLVIVADSDVMNNNARSDELDGTPAKNILFMTYLDFDDLNTGATTRKSFAAQVGADTDHQGHQPGPVHLLAERSGHRCRRRPCRLQQRNRPHHRAGGPGHRDDCRSTWSSTVTTIWT